MAEKITVQSVTDLITSQRGNQYFTFEDMGQKRYVCYNPNLKEYCKVGSEIEVDITPGKTPEDSPRLDMIYVGGKPVVQVEKKTTGGRSYGKSKEELLQIRQLAEAQNRSIQAQTSLNRAVDFVLAENIKVTAKGSALIELVSELSGGFYQLLQSLTLVSEAEVINIKIKETKSETSKISKGSQETQTKSSDRQDSGEATEPKTVGEFLTWLKNHDIKAPRTWLEVEYKVSNTEVLTVKKCRELYNQIQGEEKFNK